MFENSRLFEFQTNMFAAVLVRIEAKVRVKKKNTNTNAKLLVIITWYTVGNQFSIGTFLHLLKMCSLNNNSIQLYDMLQIVPMFEV